MTMGKPAARRTARGATGVLLFLSLASATRAADAEKAEHPFILWTRDEAKGLRAKILSEPWARERFVERFQRQSNAWSRSTVDNLFFYTMVGDRDAYDAEKPPLMGFIDAPPLVKDMTDWRWHHVDHSDMAIRYDVFYDELSPAQRRALGETFHNLAVFGIEQEPLRGFEAVRMISHMFCALGTGDKRLIRAIFNCKGGGKDYFDGIKEGRFTSGGNNPSPRTIGQIWTWCRAVERLGMNELGFGYKSADGRDLRSLLEGIVALGDPKIEIPGGMPFIGRSALALDFSPGSFHRIPMERFPNEVFRAPIVIGHLRDGDGGWGEWLNTSAGKAYDVFENGTFRMQLSLVFELAHQRWPDADFGYFLSRMRKPGADRYYPSIYFGLDPIDPAAFKPPAVKSTVYPSLGVAILRAQEGPEYWDSPAPFAVLRLARAGSRGAPGAAFALQSLHAFNRPIYQSHLCLHQFPPHWYATGKPHSTVVIDNGVAGVPDIPQLRQRLDPLVKFVAVRGWPRTWTETKRTDTGEQQVVRHAGLAPGIESERACMLTREYLFDVFRVHSEQEHTYDWMVQALGSAVPDTPAAWKPTDDLDKTLPDQTDRMPFNYREQHVLEAGAEDWALNAVQNTMATSAAVTVMGPEWYDRRIGVRVSMLGEPGTRAFFARRPLRRSPTPEERRQLEIERNPNRLLERDQKYDQVDHEVTEVQVLPPDARALKPGDTQKIKAEKKPLVLVGVVSEKYPETGGVSIIAERRASRTVFAALHEPFEKGRWRIPEFRRIEQTDRALAVAVKGKDGSPVDDRLMLRLGDEAAEPVTLSGGGETFRFGDFAFVRVAPDRVQVVGNLLGMKLNVGGRPTLIVNGEEKKAEVSGGVLSFGL